MEKNRAFLLGMGTTSLFYIGLYLAGAIDIVWYLRLLMFLNLGLILVMNVVDVFE